MSEIESRLTALGLALPPAFPVPSDLRLPFEFAQVCGVRVLLSGHGPQAADGTLAGPFGKVGADLSVSEGYQAARLVALSMLASLKRAIGDLDRVDRWHRVFGMVNSAPGFTQQPQVINGFSDLILELYGPQRGTHTRSAIGVAELPFNMPVEIEGELSLRA
ncbi:RidA family protein [Dyella solisilvae]|uniref:RidA family protein n=1 Tax=Dyella solisilvae TaxID=1920168 RepID=A0A370K7Z4_9GAMM|nr:RidA family protein [Dyella solisilvae]RDI98772.1 RidA family protein [Dyella solisilvae]